MRPPIHRAPVVRRICRVVAWVAGLLVVAYSATGSANALELGLPLDCTPGTDCWVVNYVDIDPGPAARDSACGARTYNGHDGTDFAIRDLEVMAKGVAARAAAAGRVTAVRDGMLDVDVSATGRDAVKGKECGNGVTIDHGEGWETQYCHMRRGSIAVKRGQRVTAGETLGLVGLSGLTEFPHMHLTVRKDGKARDPFTGRAQDGACGIGPDGLGPSPLWNGTFMRTLVYDPVVLFNAGITAAEPTRETLRNGTERRSSLPPDAPMIVVWVEAFGIEPGDELMLRIVAPDGVTLAETARRFDARRTYQFVYAGKRRETDAWPLGTYRGEAVLTRKGGAVPLDRRIETAIELR